MSKRVLVAFVKQGAKPVYALLRSDKLPARVGCNELQSLNLLYFRPQGEELRDANCYDFVHDNKTHDEWYVRRGHL